VITTSKGNFTLNSQLQSHGLWYGSSDECTSAHDERDFQFAQKYGISIQKEAFQMKILQNKEWLSKVIVSTIVIFALMIGSASADMSFAVIYAISDGEDGATIYMSSGKVDMSGENYNTSGNTLWVELYENKVGLDRHVGGKRLTIASGRVKWSHKNGKAGNYYVHLDPDGPYYTGCNGWGQALRD
jgi:hypothetical protein